ncbi:YicC/YloC family endoribonuclease [Membranihabitans marinus]|uniref:YicC/YloC family endoribonuclease n=1 Tax=Membranihabitans marinus TaxID=1227546 RepID=UPI001F425967|nr:YicC/YloC family endoribonuclease [Membranihabitans marinus]
MYSMTGYGSAHSQFNNFEINIEVKTLNSKYADVRLKIPSELSSMEVEIRQSVVKMAIRGKVEVVLSLEDMRSDQNLCEIDEQVFKSYYNQINRLSNEVDFGSDNMLNAILRLPGVVKVHELSISADLKKAILKVLQKALADLHVFRQTEGEVLKKALDHSVNQILTHQKAIADLDSERIDGVKTRLRTNLEQHLKKDQIDPARFEQELIYYLDKMDIHEEMVRLQQHCLYFLEELDVNDSSKGKKLTFISQEIGREINTLGAKAAHSEIQRSVVQMKNELDKIKEQLANVL